MTETTTTPVPLRKMYDSANMDAIPADAQIVAGYPHRGGTTIWNPGRFPRALVVAIDQRGDHADDCHAADVEGGAISIGTIRQWVTSWHLLHPNGLLAQNGWFARPVVYCNGSTLPSMRSALLGLAWNLWLAEWPGAGPVLQNGAIAHQYAGSATLGGDYDLSVVAPTFGVRPVLIDEPADWRDQALAEAIQLAALATHLADSASMLEHSTSALEQLIRNNTP